MTKNPMTWEQAARSLSDASGLPLDEVQTAIDHMRITKLTPEQVHGPLLEALKRPAGVDR